MFVVIMCLDLLGFSSFENQTKNGFLSGHLKAFLPQQEEQQLGSILPRGFNNTRAGVGAGVYLPPNYDPLINAVMAGIALIPWVILVAERYFGYKSLTDSSVTDSESKNIPTMGLSENDKFVQGDF